MSHPSLVISDTSDDEDHGFNQGHSSAPPTPPEQNLSESQLRELYDSEEIERFMALFSAYVTEVRLPETPEGNDSDPFCQWGSAESHITEDGQPEEVDWVPVKKSPQMSSNSKISEIIASKYVIPNLPPAAFPTPIFTLGRLRLTIQRLYLVTQPIYIPFALRLLKLATWEDYRRSAFYCTLYWVLWYHNTLLPTLILRVLYTLLRRKFLPYPSLSDLREHRSEVMRAHEFGNEITNRLSASSTFGMKEVWRLFRVLKRSKKEKASSFVKRNKVNPPSDAGGKSPESQNDKEDATVLDESDDGQDARDIKRIALHILSELADLQERVKNIFIWRRPASSKNYALILFILFLFTWLLSAQYLAKAIYFVAGFFFWHVSPILAAIPACERARLPPIFHDAPTDADYAMELISKRVAAGLDIRPPRNRQKHHTRTKSEPRNSPSQGRASPPGIPPIPDSSVNWKKWGERAALGKAWADDSSRFLSGKQSNLEPNRNLLPRQPGSMSDAHTFPAQHSTAPGLVTVTPTTLLFTSIMSSDAKITIPLSEIRGVKKVGLLKGLSVRWRSPEGLGIEEKFQWVGGRDELFARLVSHQSDGRRWLKV